MNIKEIKSLIKKKNFSLEKYKDLFDRHYTNNTICIGIVNPNIEYVEFLKKLTPNINIYTIYDGVSPRTDLVLFTGGEDVCPDYYNDIVHRTTNYNRHRDKLEKSVYYSASGRGVPSLGICRGLK
jgi:gamma-glutamyl-gamma-aminobutyrate hydrolase PuuD